jgi:hypothetical protein
MGFELKRIVMVTRYDTCSSHHIAVAIGNRQDIAGLRPFASLVRHTFPTFLGNGMTLIQIHLAQVQFILDVPNTFLPNLLQTAIHTPLALMIIHRLPSWFVTVLPFCRLSGPWQAIPLTACMQSVQHQVEDALQRRFAHIPTSRTRQIRQNVVPELVFSYTFWDGAHAWLLFGRSFLNHDAPPFLSQYV